MQHHELRYCGGRSRAQRCVSSTALAWGLAGSIFDVSLILNSAYPAAVSNKRSVPGMTALGCHRGAKPESGDAPMLEVRLFRKITRPLQCPAQSFYCSTACSLMRSVAVFSECWPPGPGTKHVLDQGFGATEPTSFLSHSFTSRLAMS